MKTMRNPGIGYDLRRFFIPAVYDADPPADTGKPPGSAGGQQADADGTPAPEGGDGSSDDGTGDAAGEGSSRIKQLSDEAARHRVRAKAAEDQLAALKDQGEALTAATTTIRELRIQNAFQRAALRLVDDLDAAWKLSDHSLVKIDDDGNVTGMDEMITAALRAYPYLERTADTMPLPVGGGSPNNGRRGNPNTANAAVLEKKFPALRRR